MEFEVLTMSVVDGAACATVVPILPTPEQSKDPLTESLEAGLLVPIPTLPLLSMRIRSFAPLVKNVSVLPRIRISRSVTPV